VPSRSGPPDGRRTLAEGIPRTSEVDASSDGGR
jgi:hypothetical protein